LRVRAQLLRSARASRRAAKGAGRLMANGEMVGSNAVLRRAWSRPQRGAEARAHARGAQKGQFERCNGVRLPHAGTVARDRGHPRSGCGLWTGDRSVCCRLTPRVRAGTQSLCEALHRWICHRPNPPPPSTKPISAFAISAAAIAISTASIAISAARTSNKAKAVITLAAASPRGYVCRRARDALLHGQSLAAQSMAAQRCRAGNGQHSQ